MGMARIMSPEEQEEFKKDVEKMNRYDVILSYFTDASFGFFIFPFSYFIIWTTVSMVHNPNTISDGVAILYIALISGAYYLLSKGTILLIETKRANLLFILLGFALFLLAFLTLNQSQWSL